LERELHFSLLTTNRKINVNISLRFLRSFVIPHLAQTVFTLNSRLSKFNNIYFQNIKKGDILLC